MEYTLEEFYKIIDDIRSIFDRIMGGELLNDFGAKTESYNGMKISDFNDSRSNLYTMYLESESKLVKDLIDCCFPFYIIEGIFVGKNYDSRNYDGLNNNIRQVISLLFLFENFDFENSEYNFDVEDINDVRKVYHKIYKSIKTLDDFVVLYHEMDRINNTTAVEYNKIRSYGNSPLIFKLIS